MKRRSNSNYEWNAEKGKSEWVGPVYNIDSPKLSKARQLARDGLQSWDKRHRQAYGAEVEKAVLARQRAEAHQGFPPINPQVNCESGTAHNEGADIEKAIRRQQQAALDSYCRNPHPDRTTKEWQEMYDRHMKRQRAQGRR